MSLNDDREKTPRIGKEQFLRGKSYQSIVPTEISTGFLSFFSPNMTHIAQPIVAAIGQSLRIDIGRGLDKWLMDGGSMLKWEAKKTARGKTNSCNKVGGRKGCNTNW
jgi:hypothetical protein